MEGDIKTWLEKDGREFLKSIGIKKGQIVLDFGCGEGHYAIPAAYVVGKKGKVYALDKDSAALDKLSHLIAKNNIANVQIINEESKTTLEGDFVDSVLCFDVIHYLKDRIPVYKEIHRILKPEGTFLLYPKHHKNDYPLMELANIRVEEIVKEAEGTGFMPSHKFLRRLLHDDYYDEGYILSFKKAINRLGSG